MFAFIVYFFTITNNGTSYVVSTMPVGSEKICMDIVKEVNSQPKAGGKNVRATCYATKEKR